MVTRALEHGYEPEQLPMTKMIVNGVGKGSQEANFKVVCPIAVPHNDGKTHLHQITAPIVEGTGSGLPGLLGLRTLQQERAILDMGRQELIFPGQGEVAMCFPFCSPEGLQGRGPEPLGPDGSQGFALAQH